MRGVDKPVFDSAQGQRDYSVVIQTLLWIQVLLGRSPELTVEQIEKFPEILIFPDQIRAIRTALKWRPAALKLFDERFAHIYLLCTPGRESVLSAYEGWAVQSFTTKRKANPLWFFPDLLANLNMESRCFLAKIQATKRASLLCTTDPVERAFAALILRPPHCG